MTLYELEEEGRYFVNYRYKNAIVSVWIHNIALPFMLQKYNADCRLKNNKKYQNQKSIETIL